MEPDAAPILEIYISSSAAYLGANDAALDMLGYAADELVGLPFGTLSGTDPEPAGRIWRGLVEHGLTIPPSSTVRLQTKAGRRIPVRFVTTEPLGGDRWVSRYRLLTGRVVDPDGPFVLQSLLAQWRELERRLAALTGDPSGQLQLEDQLTEIKDLYQFELQRRRTPGDALP